MTFDGVDLPADPFTALRVSYGMLLGEPDFEVLMGNPRGKGMLHAAWLHGRGLVWGLEVSWTPPASGPGGGTSAGSATGGTAGGVLRVEPGLAIDGWGRELRLDVAECLDLGAWAAERVRLGPEGDEPEGAGGAPSGDADGAPSEGAHSDRTLRGWVVAEFATCLDHPVPALADPCDVTRRHDVCARVVETVRLRVRDMAPAEPPDHPRVRELLGLDCEPRKPGLPTCGSPTCTNPEHQPDAPDREVEASREAVSRAGPDQRACVLLGELRRLAALDAAELAPAVEDGDVAGMFPVTEDEAGVTLARLTVRVSGAGDCVRIDEVEVDLRGRRALLPTATIQDLVAGLAPGVLGEEGAPDAGGPRLVDGSLRWSPEHTQLEFRLTTAAMRGSLEHGIGITSLSPRHGWADDEIAGVSLHDQGRRVVVHLDQPPAYPLVRVRIRGTGPTPIVGVDPVAPFAGHEGSPPGSADDGHDAVVMRRLPRRGNGYDANGDEGNGYEPNGDESGDGEGGDDGYVERAGRDRT
jgi:hypothetical protein